jgi:hypothetical protein
MSTTYGAMGREQTAASTRRISNFLEAKPIILFRRKLKDAELVEARARDVSAMVI